jgi:hypothetical protein
MIRPIEQVTSTQNIWFEILIHLEIVLTHYVLRLIILVIFHRILD